MGCGLVVLCTSTMVYASCVHPYMYCGNILYYLGLFHHMCMYVSLCPSVPRESGTHPSPSHIPHVYVCILMSILSQRTMREWDTSQSIPYTTCMCVYPYVHPIPSYHGRVGHIPVCPIYHMYMCVSLCPSCPSVPWESGTHPSPSHIPHVSGCVYPYVHPVPVYHGRVSHIPVYPIHAYPASPHYFCEQHYELRISP